MGAPKKKTRTKNGLLELLAAHAELQVPHLLVLGMSHWPGFSQRAKSNIETLKALRSQIFSADPPCFLV